MSKREIRGAPVREIHSLPPEKVAQVEDLVEFPSQRREAPVMVKQDGAWGPSLTGKHLLLRTTWRRGGDSNPRYRL